MRHTLLETTIPFSLVIAYLVSPVLVGDRHQDRIAASMEGGRSFRTIGRPRTAARISSDLQRVGVLNSIRIAA
jgi:hypothetical protein